MSDVAAQAQNLIAASGALGMPMLQHREEILRFVAWYLERFGRPRRILEIGSGHGGSTALWCEMAQGPDAQVVAVDIPMGVHPGGLSPQDAMLRDARLKARYPAFHAVTADSQRPETYSLVMEVMGGPFDLLFIDGDHHYESVKRDFETYSPLVREGYPVLFHDIMDTSYYRALGINVARLWSELPGEKVEWVSRPGGDSGGLGAVIVSSPPGGQVTTAPACKSCGSHRVAIALPGRETTCLACQQMLAAATGCLARDSTGVVHLWSGVVVLPCPLPACRAVDEEAGTVRRREDGRD